MRVKKNIQIMSTELKNLKVSKESHTKASIARLEDDVRLQDWVECAIELALKERPKLRRLLEDRKKQEVTKASK